MNDILALDVNWYWGFMDDDTLHHLWVLGELGYDSPSYRVCKFDKACGLGSPNNDCELWREGRC